MINPSSEVCKGLSNMFILMPQTGGMSVWITKTTGGKKMKKRVVNLIMYVYDSRSGKFQLRDAGNG